MNRKKFRSGYWTPVAARSLCEFFGVGDTNAAVFKLEQLRARDPNNAGPVLAEFVASAMAYAYREAKLELEMEDEDRADLLAG